PAGRRHDILGLFTGPVSRGILACMRALWPVLFALGCAGERLPASRVPKMYFGSPVTGMSCRSSASCQYHCFARDRRLALGQEAEGECDTAGRGERGVVEDGRVAGGVVVD